MGQIRKLAGRWGYLVVLLAPVIFLLIFTPPLWRDSDGWNQITKAPGVYTLLHWPPGYCFGARLPLWAGTMVGWLGGFGDAPVQHFFTEPNLTMPGIYGLIIAQHLLLLGTLTGIVEVLAGTPALRFIIAVLLAWQTPFYVFAHTVGSETLSLIGELIFLTLAWHMASSRNIPGWKTWLAAGTVLFLLLITRQVNVGFCGVLPLFYLLRAGAAWTVNRSEWTACKASLGAFVRATIIAIVALAAAKGLILGLCHWNDLEARSRAGFTFQWRLRSIQSLPAPEQADVWSRVLPALADVPELQDLLKEESALAHPPDPSAIYDRLLAKMEASQPGTKKKLLRAEADEQLNVLCRKFISHSGMPYWRMVWREFWTGLDVMTGDLVKEPFVTTGYFWREENREDRSSKTLRKLAGFQWFERMGGDYTANPYLKYAPGAGSVQWWCIASFVAALLLLVTKWPLRAQATFFVLSSLAGGGAIWFATKLMAEPLARYILPLYGVAVFTGILMAAAWLAISIPSLFRLREPGGRPPRA